MPRDRIPTSWSDWIREKNVSCETLNRLDIYADMLAHWSPHINLVASGTLAELRERHILDSAQLLAHIPEDARHLCDLGSGAGLPGLVLAAFAAELRPALRIELVESDHRKTVFLREAARSMNVVVRVFPARAEDLPTREADVVTARALAPLVRLLPLARRHLRPGGRAIFPKGAGWENEVREAQRTGAFTATAASSLTDSGARILVIEGLADD